MRTVPALRAQMYESQEQTITVLTGALAERTGRPANDLELRALVGAMTGGLHQVVLDWGDSFVGNPLIDELAFTQPLDPDDAAAARGWFLDAWRRISPTADPERAADLLRPVLPLLAAVTYDAFCAAIEPDERVYHRTDVVTMLERAVVEAGLD